MRQGRAPMAPVALSGEQAAALLALAIQKKDDMALEGLLAAGADPDSVTYYPKPERWRSALGCAVERGSLRAVELLLSHGANPDGVAGFAEEPLAKAEHKPLALRMCCSTALLASTPEEAGQKIKALLLAGADASQGGAWRKLLDDIWERGDELVPLFKAMVEGGADVEASSEDGQSALWLAVRDGREGLARALVELGADPDRLNEGMFNEPAKTPYELADDEGAPIAGEMRAIWEARALGALVKNAERAPSRSM